MESNFCQIYRVKSTKQSVFKFVILRYFRKHTRFTQYRHINLFVYIKGTSILKKRILDL